MTGRVLESVGARSDTSGSIFHSEIGYKFHDLFKESLPMEIGKSRHWTSVFFCRCASNVRCAQGQPKKEFHRTTKAIAEMNAD